MTNVNTPKKFAKNIILSIIAQIISLSVSFIINLILPKFIDEYQYSYWQTYVLYISYTGFFHFGLIDGIVLRYSQYDYDEIDKPRLRSQFKILLTSTTIITALVTIVSLLACKGVTQTVFILLAFAIVIDNQYAYTSYTFQISNRINLYVAMTITYRLIHGLLVIILLILKVNNFYWYCISDLAGKVISVFVFSFFNKNMYWGKSLDLKETFKEYKLNVIAGVALMISSFTANLLLGGAKMIIQWRWDNLTFGKVSFAFSISNIFLTFITAVSIVLFPSLKRMNQESLPAVYKNTRNLMSPVLFFALLMYFPGCWLLEKWLPAYSSSLTYLGLLLPIIIYLSKVNLLTNNYLKAYRKERLLLIVNLVSAALGMGLFALFGFVFSNLTLVLISVVIVVMLNSIVSELIVSKIINVKMFKDIIFEVIMTAGFILSVKFLNIWIACLVYFVMFILYCIANYKTFIAIFKRVLKKNN